jgi:hypothetical protein
MSFNGLPGRRVEEYRAGITQIDFISRPPIFSLNITVAKKFFKAEKNFIYPSEVVVIIFIKIFREGRREQIFFVSKIKIC